MSRHWLGLLFVWIALICIKLNSYRNYDLTYIVSSLVAVSFALAYLKKKDININIDNLNREHSKQNITSYYSNFKSARFQFGRVQTQSDLRHPPQSEGNIAGRFFQSALASDKMAGSWKIYGPCGVHRREAFAPATRITDRITLVYGCLALGEQ